MTPILIEHSVESGTFQTPSKGVVGMASLIVAEIAMFSIFVVAYIYYMGTDKFGPTPRQVLELPVFNTVCLLSSSLTIWLAERSIEHRRMTAFTMWWGSTCLLGSIFLIGTAREWSKLIYHDGLTIRTNLFGTTFYSLVGLHATHVAIGLLLMLFIFILAITKSLGPEHADRVKVLALYWHFVDVVWVIVFTVVYVVGR
jgi:cytochrome c oxidase subunit 3/cytochrome o ubiquinol oxidase subunit 3